jgi:hypothetical protein
VAECELWRSVGCVLCALEICGLCPVCSVVSGLWVQCSRLIRAGTARYGTGGDRDQGNVCHKSLLPGHSYASCSPFALRICGRDLCASPVKARSCSALLWHHSGSIRQLFFEQTGHWLQSQPVEPITLNRAVLGLGCATSEGSRDSGYPC